MRNSANLVTSLSLPKLAYALGLWAACGPTIHADPPVQPGSQPVRQVEQWRGLRRDDQQPKNAEDSKPSSQQAAEDAAGQASAKLADAARPSDQPGITDHGLPPAPSPMPAPSVPPSVWLLQTPSSENLTADASQKMLTAGEAMSQPKETCQGTRARTSSDLSEAQEQVAPVVPRGVNGPARSDHTAAGANTDGLEKTLVQAAIILAVALLAPIASLVCFFWLLRRHSRHYGPLFRIDYTGATPVVTGPVTASTVALETAAEVEPVADRGDWLEELNAQPPARPAASADEVAEQFELGPTFEDDRRRQEELVKQQEEAVLQHLLEDNLRLQEEIERASEQ